MMNEMIRKCEQAFRNGGPYYHVCTKSSQSDIYYNQEAEMGEVLNILALSVCESDCGMLSYALMSNHFHFILEAELEHCMDFFELFLKRFRSFLGRKGKGNLARLCKPQYIRIDSLRQLKDEIAYVIRNPFVVRPDINPLSFLWCSGHLYFNPLLQKTLPEQRVCDLSVQARRKFRHERRDDIDPRLRLKDEVVVPASFVDYQKVEALFGNAREYLYVTLKNVEAQVAIAKRLGEFTTVDDKDLRLIILRRCREQFHVEDPKELGSEDRIALIHALKYEFNASNAQITRCIGLEPGYVDQIFPLSAKSHE